MKPADYLCDAILAATGCLVVALAAILAVLFPIVRIAWIVLLIPTLLITGALLSVRSSLAQREG